MADEETSVETPPAGDAPAEPAEAQVEAAPAADAAAEAEATSADGAPAEAAEGEGAAAEGEAVDDEVAGAIADELRGLSGGDEQPDAPGDAGAAAGSFHLAPDVSDELQRILRISVPVIVKLADKQLPLGEIIDLSPGSIVEFTKSADTPLELLVNNKTIGRGVAVKVGEKFGLRIDEIKPMEETIRSLGGQ